MKALAMVAGLGGMLAGCTTVPPPAATTLPPQRLTFTTVGLERVMGHDADALQNLLGKPDADVTEGQARKLQFSSGICVLDAYLYPPKSGGKPVVTYIDARQRDGRPIDRASCVAALTRRDGGK